MIRKTQNWIKKYKVDGLGKKHLCEENSDEKVIELREKVRKM